MPPLAVVNDTQRQQFQVHMDGEIGYLEYRMHEGKLVLMHTEVPDSLSGRGIASAIAAFAFDYARENKLPVKVYCPFVLTWLKRHPELSDLLAPRHGE